jgi:hypothetical protein
MKYAVETSFIQIGSAIQKLMGRGGDHRQHGHRISLLSFFFQNKESRLKGTSLPLRPLRISHEAARYRTQTIRLRNSMISLNTDTPENPVGINELYILCNVPSFCNNN